MTNTNPNKKVKTLYHSVGYFTSRILQEKPDGSQFIIGSRRFRKGLAPIKVDSQGTVHIPEINFPSWLHFWAPQRLAWWISLLFIIGSAGFIVSGFASNWPQLVPVDMSKSNFINIVSFVGSLFFTGAAWLQLLEVLNADVLQIGTTNPSKQTWRWFAWKPHNAGFSASFIQLIGTLLFNVNTANVMLSGLTLAQEESLIWGPDLIGSICFLVASHLALVEVGHRWFSFLPRKLSWWIVAINMLGSLAFMLAAVFAFVVPETGELEWLWGANLFTLIGAVMFLLASYLMIPELFGAAPGITPEDLDKKSYKTTNSRRRKKG